MVFVNKLIENSPTFYTILNEVLDFLTAFVKVDDNNVLQEVLACFYVVSTAMNKNVVVYHENIVQKLLLLMKNVTGIFHYFYSGYED